MFSFGCSHCVWNGANSALALELPMGINAEGRETRPNRMVTAPSGLLTIRQGLLASTFQTQSTKCWPLVNDWFFSRSYLFLTVSFCLPRWRIQFHSLLETLSEEFFHTLHPFKHPVSGSGPLQKQCGARQLDMHSLYHGPLITEPLSYSSAAKSSQFSCYWNFRILCCLGLSRHEEMIWADRKSSVQIKRYQNRTGEDLLINTDASDKVMSS